ncbi:hypothetical protein E1B28_002993 [Marasmius oreades]|uniref:Ricin B lectin domain-containing protein n=1 Tax=Marasmius oreades TaxID=181124 RepID=A0A9P7RL76_9AGAR|nr:uncharacterized protein E1B28_002993 [Marasmius oreades]KAG7085432.1 hypothetical protein E1B28_002993 [Marasmius oreades]
MAPVDVIQGNGTYRIVNAKSQTLLDLSQGDQRSIIGWPRNDAANQHWTLLWAGNAWHIQSPSNGLYLGLGGSGTPGDGVPLIATAEPTTGWDIWQDNVNPEAYRIFIPNTFLNWDLWANGDATPGNPVTLWTSWSGIHQTWKFEPV